MAADAFREDGLGVSVNAIADAAGVNIATLYRHFPAKDDLVSAVLEELLTPLVAARDSALERDGSLATFLHEAARMQAAYQGLIDAQLYQPLSAEVREQLRDPAEAIVAPIAERAHADGTLRADLDAKDLLIALRMIAGLVGTPTLTAGDVSRHVDVILRGLRP